MSVPISMCARVSVSIIPCVYVCLDIFFISLGMNSNADRQRDRNTAADVQTQRTKSYICLYTTLLGLISLLLLIEMKGKHKHIDQTQIEHTTC